MTIIFAPFPPFTFRVVYTFSIIPNSSNLLIALLAVLIDLSISPAIVSAFRCATPANLTAYRAIALSVLRSVSFKFGELLLICSYIALLSSYLLFNDCYYVKYCDILVLLLLF